MYVAGRQYPVEIFYTNEPQQDYLDSTLIAILQIHQIYSKQNTQLKSTSTQNSQIQSNQPMPNQSNQQMSNQSNQQTSKEETESITNLIPLIVIEVSATFVAKITFRQFFGVFEKAFICSSAGNAE